MPGVTPSAAPAGSVEGSGVPHCGEDPDSGGRRSSALLYGCTRLAITLLTFHGLCTMALGPSRRHSFDHVMRKCAQTITLPLAVSSLLQTHLVEEV
jgi:hypothetical protein